MEGVWLDGRGDWLLAYLEASQRTYFGARFFDLLYPSMNKEPPAVSEWAAQLDPLWPMLERASRLGLLAVAVLYVIGLLIVNVELGRYGMIEVNLARAEYVMAGTLWAILIAVVWIAVRYYMSIFSSVFGRGRRWLTRVLGLILLILVPFGGVSIALVQSGPIFFCHMADAR
jgi:hypothetical protein